MRIRYYVEFLLIYSLTRGFYYLPHTLSLKMGEFLGEIFYALSRRRRQIALKNLEIAFGTTYSPSERSAIARSACRNLGKSLIETIRLSKLDKTYLKTKVTLIGLENYLKARDKGRGVIVYTGHFGNWELAAVALAAQGYFATLVVRPLDNPLLDRWASSLRTRFGHTLLTSRKSLRDMMKVLKNKESLAILIDQNTSKEAGVFVDFFGKPACTTPVVALLALKYEAPIVPMFIIRTGLDEHTLYIEKEVPLQRTGDIQRDIQLNTATITQILEDYIRRYPDQWFWVHNRWKTQPHPSS